jgi:hypothetical protein
MDQTVLVCTVDTCSEPDKCGFVLGAPPASHDIFGQHHRPPFRSLSFTSTVSTSSCHLWHMHIHVFCHRPSLLVTASAAAHRDYGRWFASRKPRCPARPSHPSVCVRSAPPELLHSSLTCGAISQDGPLGSHWTNFPARLFQPGKAQRHAGHACAMNGAGPLFTDHPPT